MKMNFKTNTWPETYGFNGNIGIGANVSHQFTPHAAWSFAFKFDGAWNNWGKVNDSHSTNWLWDKSPVFWF